MEKLENINQHQKILMLCNRIGLCQGLMDILKKTQFKSLGYDLAFKQLEESLDEIRELAIKL